MMVPGITFDHNTFYANTPGEDVMLFSGSLVRGDPSRATLTSNVFLGNGRSRDTANGTDGFYNLYGFLVTGQVIRTHVTLEAGPTYPIADGIGADLIAHGYIDASNGFILQPLRDLTTIADLILDPAYDAYKSVLWDHLQQSVTYDNQAETTFYADYNYVGGSASAGYPSKRTSGCLPGRTNTDANFCEAHGINGGDPKLSNLTNILGADGLPFTLDDGLKPLPGSPLCGKGYGGIDIGAYSCSVNVVFAGVPTAPTNVQIR
jgi:hypothetical protein